MLLGGGGLIWGLLIFLVLAFLALLMMWSPSPGTVSGVAGTGEVMNEDEEDLDELDDFMDMQDDV